MSTLIQKIGKLSVQTFNRDNNRSNFKANFDQLSKLANTLTKKDINLDPSLVLDTGTYDYSSIANRKAPVTYMNIFQNTDVSIGIFILKRGVRLPLHDHPDMHGLLKVLHGTISIQSYTLSGMLETSEEKNGSNVYTAKKFPSILVNPDSEICRLTPEFQNIHEIKSVEGPAAFLDILAPPYGIDKKSGVERDCHYFSEIDIDSSNFKELAENIVFLINTSLPKDYWCDQADYNGPSLDSLAN